MPRAGLVRVELSLAEVAELRTWLDSAEADLLTTGVFEPISSRSLAIRGDLRHQLAKISTRKRRPAASTRAITVLLSRACLSWLADAAQPPPDELEGHVQRVLRGAAYLPADRPTISPTLRNALLRCRWALRRRAGRPMLRVVEMKQAARNDRAMDDRHRKRIKARLRVLETSPMSPWKLP